MNWEIQLARPRCGRRRHSSRAALANEFRKLEHRDWQEWRQQQEWRLQQADNEDDATYWRLQDYYPYSDCRAKLLATRRECAQGGDFFDSECD